MGHTERPVRSFAAGGAGACLSMDIEICPVAAVSAGCCGPSVPAAGPADPAASCARPGDEFPCGRVSVLV